MRVRCFLLLALILPLLAACSAGPACRPGAESMTRLELLFGTARADGPPVSEAEWSDFVDREVTPRFPEGLSMLVGLGQWRDAQGQVIKEGMRMLLIWYRPTAERAAAIEAIRAAYKARFEQESVLRADGVSCLSF